MQPMHEAKQIAQGVWWVGALDPDLRIFDVVMQTQHGTSYNAYLVRGKKTALIDMVKDGFSAQALQRVACVIDPSLIDYIVVNHAEPDHTGALRDFIGACPNAEILASRAGVGNLQNLFNQDGLRVRAVKPGENVDLGGMSLQFVEAPFLHWPDSMMTFCPEAGALFSCDVFGFHQPVPELFADESASELEAAKKYYFDVIFAPFKKYVLSAVQRVRALPVVSICPSHGPVYRRDPMAVVDQYERWAREDECARAKKLVYIGYVSAYGYTRALATALAEGVRSAGADVDLADIAAQPDICAVQAMGADALLVGSPTLNRDVLPPVWTFLAHLSGITQREKRAGAFGSYGWSGEAVPMVEQRLASLGYKLQPMDVRCKLRPSAQDLENARQAGRVFAEAL